MPAKPEAARRYELSRYHAAKRNGLCVFHTCRKPPMSGMVYCAEHRAYMLRAWLKRKIKKGRVVKPTNVSQLFDYLDVNPWLKRASGSFAGEVFKAKPDRRGHLIWEGKTATYLTLDGIVFDDTGFSVAGGVGGDTWRIRFEYTEAPKEA